MHDVTLDYYYVIYEDMHHRHYLSPHDEVFMHEMFSNAHDLTINGGNYYNGNTFIQHASSQESSQGIVPGIRVIAFEDISINRQIHKNPGYRLHSEGRARVVKVYQGPRARERAQEAARFHKKIMHPALMHLVGVSPLTCEIPFLAFNGGLEGSLEVSISKALEKDLRKSVILGLQTVIGLSSGLDYLQDVDYPFITAGLEHFGAFINLKGEVVINFDPDITYEKNDEQSPPSEVDQPLLIFHELCKRTFDAARQAHYERQQVERTYDDALETEDAFVFSDDRYKDINGTSSTSTNSSSKKNIGKSPLDGHRRELVWKSEINKRYSLECIYTEFKDFLDSIAASSELRLDHRHGRYTARTTHRCPGYNRTEITLTPSITRSAIVSHSTPLPHEICPVCKQVVKDVEEIFRCNCGREDDEFLPTIQCSECREWHHRRCVGYFELMEPRFTCPRCRRTKDSRRVLNNAVHQLPGNNGPKRLRYTHETTGPQHSPIWTVTVYIDNIEYGRGVGRTRAAASDAAATQALAELNDEYQ